MINTLVYLVPCVDGSEAPVVGIQVGRFAVREMQPDEIRVDQTGVLLPQLGQWLVEHIPSGWAMGEFHTLSRALRAADELSAHALIDPDAPDEDSAAALDAQLGPELCEWLIMFFRNVTDLGFRQWMAEQGRPVPMSLQVQQCFAL